MEMTNPLTPNEKDGDGVTPNEPLNLSFIFLCAAKKVSLGLDCSTTQALWKLSCLLEAAHKSLVSIRIGLRSLGCLHALSTSCRPSICAIRTSYTLVLTSCADYCSLPPMQIAAPYLLCRPLLLTSCADCCSLPPVQTVVPYLLRRLLLLTSRGDTAPYLLRRHCSSSFRNITSPPEETLFLIL
ncbi:hypothetical protein Tco_0609919 [Tanacetum coccineum]